MRKLLMLGVATSFLLGGVAMASGPGDDVGSNPPAPPVTTPAKHKAPVTVDAFLALASAQNGAGSHSNRAVSIHQNTSASTSGSFSGSKGLISQAQNAGANSTLQNALSLAYVTNKNGPKTYGVGLAVAGASNGAGVFGNHDFTRHTNQSASIGDSFNGSSGVVQSNQNVGDNSVLQNATSVASVSPVTGSNGELGIVLAGSHNGGGVTSNDADNFSTNNSTSVASSFDGSQGIASLNQNSGADSMMQNSVALATETLKPTSASTLAATVAQASNDGGVQWNAAANIGGNNSASMSNSFNGSQGIIQASQNSGSNSLIQNTVSVGAVN